VSQPIPQTQPTYANKQPTQTTSLTNFRLLTFAYVTMATAFYTAETHQLVLNAIKSMQPQQRCEIRDALEAEGVNVKTKASTSRQRSKKQSAEAKHDLPFDDSVCHARRIVEMCHPNTNTPVYRNPNATTHIGCIDFQCRQKINSDGLCKDCLNSKKRVCAEAGPLPFKRFNEPRPAAPTRVSRTNGKKHEYVWMEDTQNNDDYIDLLNSPDQPASTRTSKKSSTSSSDDDSEINWSELVQTDKWYKSVRVPALRKILEQEGLNSKGGKAELVERVSEHFMSKDDDQDDNQDDQSADENTLQTEQLDENPQETEDDSENVLDQQDDQTTEDDSENTPVENVEKDEDEDEDDEDEENWEGAALIDGVKYLIKDGSFVDIETGRIMADDDEDDPEDWIKKSRALHKANIEKLQANI